MADFKKIYFGDYSKEGYDDGFFKNYLKFHRI